MGSLFEQVVKEMKAHPITLTLVLIGMAAITFGYTDFARAAEVEVLKASLEHQEKISTCRWLSDKIDDLETTIYVLERDEAEPEWINEKKAVLRKLKGRFNQATCSSTSY